MFTFEKLGLPRLGLRGLESGLAIATPASSIPAFTARTTGDPVIIERFGNVPGCWLATRSDRGSRVVDMDATETGARL